MITLAQTVGQWYTLRIEQRHKFPRMRGSVLR